MSPDEIVRHSAEHVLADAVRQTEHIELRPADVDTNIVIFRVSPELATAPALAAALKEQGVLVLAVGADLIRAVTHLHIAVEDAQRAAKIITQTVEEVAAGKRRAVAEEIAY